MAQNRPGKLHRSVTVVSSTRTKTGSTDVTLKSNARCSIVPASGGERSVGTATGQAVSHKFVFRYEAGSLVTSSHTLIDEDSVRYTVTNVNNIDRRWQEVYARQS